MRRALPVLALLPSLAAAQTVRPADLALDTRFVRGLNGPVAAEFLPDGRLVIIQQGGAIRVRPAGGGALINAGSVAVDVNSERGLLGLAVDPDFASTNRLYLYYSVQGSPTNDRHHVGWTTIDPATSVVDTGNIHTLVTGLFGPANHNGGGLAFGPDGNLYIGVGDTGCNCGCAPGTANNYFPTCLTNGNGKILRVDRDGNIPPTNPLVNVAAVPACGANPRPAGSMSDGCNAPLYQTQTGAPRLDIYNWGFRNPWRFSFDPIGGHLWIGDVGEVTYEEVTISTGPGQHHGWPFREGMHGQPGTSCQTATPQAAGTSCVEPALEYPHNRGAGSITGGVFTTHCSWPAAYQGRYWFADYTSDIRKVSSVMPNATRDGVDAASLQEVLTNAEGIVHFANGPDGALYLVNANNGAIWRLAPTTPASCNPDAGEPDTGTFPDAAAPDAAPAPDAGPASDDATVAPSDDATVAPSDDAAVAPSDDAAVAPNADAAPSPAGDAGTSAAADAGGGVDTAGSGCGCASSRGDLAPPALLFAAALLALRRRRAA